MSRMIHMIRVSWLLLVVKMRLKCCHFQEIQRMDFMYHLYLKMLVRKNVNNIENKCGLCLKM